MLATIGIFCSILFLVSVSLGLLSRQIRMSARFTANEARRNGMRSLGNGIALLSAQMVLLTAVVGFGASRYLASFRDPAAVPPIDVAYFLAQTLTTVGFGDALKPSTGEVLESGKSCDSGPPGRPVVYKEAALIVMLPGTLIWALATSALIVIAESTAAITMASRAQDPS